MCLVKKQCYYSRPTLHMLFYQLITDFTYLLLCLNRNKLQPFTLSRLLFLICKKYSKSFVHRNTSDINHIASQEFILHNWLWRIQDKSQEQVSDIKFSSGIVCIYDTDIWRVAINQLFKLQKLFTFKYFVVENVVFIF